MFKPISESQKFSSGSELWLIFFEPDRHLFKEINWRTHFLLKDLGDNEALLKPLLLDTYKYFPNNSILCLPFKKETWLKDAHHFWKQLDKPSCRIFIPLNCDEEELINFWPEVDSLNDLSYYRKLR